MSDASPATLVAVTPEAERALGGAHEVRLTHFPFRFGRESRSPNTDRTRPMGLRLGTAPQLNDIYLLEPPYSDIFYISREHFAIECVDNQFALVDRGSACGTIVSGKTIGSDRGGGRVELRHGDTIIVGTDESRYVFRFEIASGTA